MIGVKGPLSHRIPLPSGDTGAAAAPSSLVAPRGLVGVARFPLGGAPDDPLLKRTGCIVMAVA
jgi:hypothetical protein